jgi:hypothetical protein
MSWKKMVLGLVAAVVASAWLALAIAFVIGPKAVGIPIWTGIVVFAAVSTEGGIWITAAVLGVSIFQARSRIWRWVTRQSATPPA